MKGMSSMFRRIGIATFGLSLGLFGCPPASTGIEDVGDSSGDSGRPAAGQSGNDATNNSDGGTTVLGRNANVRPSSPTLFVVDVTVGVSSYGNAHQLNGNIAPGTFIDALRVPGAFPLSAVAAVVDRTGALILRDTKPALNFYGSAATVTGAPAPGRQIAGPATGLADISDDSDGMAYDRENDRLFVRSRDRVLVFEGATLEKNGDAAPTRVFSNADFIGGNSIALGPNGDLYIADGEQSIRVISNAGQRSGAVTPDRVLFLSFFVTDNIFVDSSDHLYITNGAEIAVLAGASKLNDRFETFPRMQLQGVSAVDETGSAQPEIDALCVDSRGIGYVADRANAAIHVIDRIATRTGEVRADRAIHGPAVKFKRPFAIFLWE